MARPHPQKAAASWVLCLLLLAACGSEPRQDRARVQFEAPAPAGTATDAPPAKSGGVLDFTAPKLGGGRVVGSEFAGQNLAIWFWAPW